jgi:hypothetical protein
MRLFFQALENNQNLLELDVSNNNFTGILFIYLFIYLFIVYLFILFHFIYLLHLISDNGLAVLISALGTKSCLRKLNFDGNKITKNGLLMLRNYLKFDNRVLQSITYPATDLGKMVEKVFTNTKKQHKNKQNTKINK